MLGLNQIINGYTFNNDYFKTTAGSQQIFTSEYGDEHDNVGSKLYLS
ncbi:hypothetical protein [Weissella oryzae]|nr:hypothetical protein [Weissella oryzae]